ncbi:MAG TPA: Crp/Fnr family transcriptional regulator [Burkholderiaceae bacterium]|nr:Crp/Fnr family transcriptional regulator [Burkholderiaceae bacterium]
MSHNENHLIQLLGRVERKRLVDRCELVEMTLSEVLNEAAVRTRHVYFPTEGFVSLVVEVDGRPGLEVGMVGCEGMLGAELLLGHSSARWRVVVQGSGRAWRLKAALFQDALAESARLRQVVARYLAFRFEQLTLGAACERFHEIGPRLARWLLMSQDRAERDTFHVTQEFLAFMLGVRRVGVTVAAGALQRQGLIGYHRGELTVVNRAGLQQQACSCYESNLRVYERLVH